MKINFSQLENKYYYAINRYFWHLLIALSILSIVIGILVYTWTYVPPSKRQVEKGPKPEKTEYPAAQKVDASDIIAALPRKARKTQPTPKPETPTSDELDVDYETSPAPPQTHQVDSAAMREYFNTMAMTKELIPYTQNKSFWDNKYQYYFASERDRKLYRKTKNPAFRKRQLTRKGFDIRFAEYAERQGYKDYEKKKQLLSALNIMLVALDSTNRKKFAEKFITTFPAHRYDVATIHERFKAMAPVVSALPPDRQFSGYRMLWNFISRNPNDGLEMVKYEGKIIERIQKDQRADFLRRMEREYYAHYNNNLNAFVESTDNFIKMLPQLPSSNQAEALRIYYDYYRRNNNERSRRIREIDREYAQAVTQWENDYQQRLRQAQNEYMAKKRRKKHFREWSVESMAGAFASVLILTIILLIVSMIRNINRLTEAIYENNRQMNHHVEHFLSQQNQENGEE